MLVHPMAHVVPHHAFTTVAQPGGHGRGGNLPRASLSGPRMRRVVTSLVMLAAVGGCAHGASGGGTTKIAFWDSSALGPADDEPDRLAAAAHGDGRARAVRLERLLDLVDAARLGGDDDARDVLWQALGGHSSGRGPEATREALTRLLVEATALDDLGVPDDDARSFVNDAIALLTTDLQPPVDADALAVRTLAYRSLATHGHPRIRDNARWRLYDHVRGTLAAAIARPPESRIDVAVQARYVAQESLEAELADGAVHTRARWEGAAGLVALLEAQRAALAADGAWAGAMAARADEDGELAAAVLAALPAARTAPWRAPIRPRGTGQAESLAPVLHLSAGRADIDAGRPQARALALDDDDVTVFGDAVRDTLAQDGRGALLLVADGELPAPELRRALRAIRRGSASRVEFAVLEPHAAGGHVATALPVTVVRDTAGGASTAAVTAARIHVHVGGRGVEYALDGKWLPGIAGGVDQIEARLAAIRRAYPRERTVRLTLGPDLRYEQIVDVLVALVGGTAPRFAVAGWLPDEARPAGTADPSLDRLLADRIAWADVRGVAIDQPFPLAGDDQQRLRAFADALPRCLPELGTRPAKARAVEVHVTLAEGRLRTITPPVIPGVGAPRIAAMTTCLQDEGLALRLREHRDTMSITLRGG